MKKTRVKMQRFKQLGKIKKPIIEYNERKYIFSIRSLIIFAVGAPILSYLTYLFFDLRINFWLHEIVVKQTVYFLNLFFNMGMAYGELDQKEKAIEAFTKALEIKPNSANNHFGLAMVYQMTAEDKLAEKEFLKALEINPKHVDARLMLSLLYTDWGMLQKASQELRKILEFDPNNISAKQFLQRIEREWVKPNPWYINIIYLFIDPSRAFWDINHKRSRAPGYYILLFNSLLWGLMGLAFLSHFRFVSIDGEPISPYSASLFPYGLAMFLTFLIFGFLFQAVFYLILIWLFTFAANYAVGFSEKLEDRFGKEKKEND